jgi:hypothetical protein
MKRRLFRLAAVVAALGLSWWFFRPLPRVDPARVDPRLSSLREPYLRVRAERYLDGGSVGIEILDANGQTGQFFLPAPMSIDREEPHRRVFAGAMHYLRPGAVEIPDAEHTRRKLVHILNDYPGRTRDEDGINAILTGRPVEFVKVLATRISERLEPVITGRP